MSEIEFVLARVDDGDTLALPLAQREAVLVKLEGPAADIGAGGVELALPARSSVFTDEPSAVYAPPGGDLELRGPLLAGIFLAEATGEPPEPYAVLPEDVASVDRGRDNFSRRVRDIIPADRPALRLLVGETLNPPGNWSSAPPHKHDRHAPPDEAELEEIYLFRMDPTAGFGFQGSYETDPPQRAAFLIHDLDVVTIPAGYHPVVAAPGYGLYYLWGLAGRGRELNWFPDPAHSWVDQP